MTRLCRPDQFSAPLNSGLSERFNFLSEREAMVRNLSKGQYVKHSQYGCGIITESDADRTTIDFDIHGIKKFVTSIMAVEPAQGTPPKRRRAKGVAKQKPVSTAACRVFVPGAK